MFDKEQELGHVLESAALPAGPSPERAQAVHQRVRELLRASGRRPRRWPIAVAAGVCVVGAAALGAAGTQAGRDMLRRMFTKIEPLHMVSVTPDESSQLSLARSGAPFTQEEADAAKAQLEEVAAIKKSGGGRLTGILEGPGLPQLRGSERMRITYLIEYTLGSGTKISVGDGGPNPAQRENMRLDEIERLRDGGAGETLSEKEFPIGLGLFTLRFTLSDGQTVDISTNYPPGTRAEREAIFDEVAQLKQARQFTVLTAERLPNGQVYGTLRYTLADGRTVGIVGEVPPDVISADGDYISTGASESPEETP
jgi:hypothetical protein